MISEPSHESLSPEIIKIVKSDLYHLVRTYCNSYKIADFTYELFLHDFTRIEYEIIPIIELEKFISLVDRYWSYFSYLISNMSFDEERITVEQNERATGSIDVLKTSRARINHQTTRLVVCTTNNKHIFTYENILLASIILSINLIANKFLKHGSEEQIDHFRSVHKSYLEKIIEYTQFLLKDRLLKRLVGHYLVNYENIEEIVIG